MFTFCERQKHHHGDDLSLYTRRNLSNNSFDSYNVVPFDTEQEFWRNGRTTHLMMSSTTGSNSPSSASADEDSISLPPRTKSDHEQSRSNTHTNIVRNSLIAGSVSGMASTVALYPLDVSC